MVYPFFVESKFEKVSDILAPLMRDYGLGAKADEYKILRIWDRAVGDKISSHAQPKMLIRGVLTVAVDSPAWMQQLTFYKEDLIDRINNGIEKDVITDIHFRIGKVEKNRFKNTDSRLKTDITPLQSEKIEGYLEPVKDPEVREIIKGAITKAFVSGRKRK